MALVKFKRKTSVEIEQLPIEDGSLIYDIETGKTYMDYNDERIPTGGGSSGSSDIIIIGDESQATEDTKLIIEDADLDFQPEEIVNEESNSTQKGYSAKYTNDRNTYSTDEVFTGKYWINGKKIYRKVIHSGNCSLSATPIKFASGFSNVDIVTELRFMYKYSSIWYKNWNLKELGYDNALNEISVATFDSASFSDSYIIIEYTKTTD